MTQWLYLVCGGLLLSSVLVLWRRELAAIVRLLAVQGILLGALAGTLAVRLDSIELGAVAIGVLVLKAIVVPGILRRVLRDSGEARETEPLINMTASIVAAALLILLAYAASRPIVRLAPSAETQAVPVGLAMVLLGFFVLVSRRRALSQIVGFLLLDNGIATTAFLITGGVPGIVELAVSLDVLLVVLVLQVLTARLRATFGATDIDELRELHD
ncbi:hydrogenase HycP [Kribbella yunnanensis]|uniref:Hydrogenase HycP n=1 Tax=Kribbella yunnanensis TaxID=190194 RepID=A0ABN2JCM5_9ACTN